MAMTLRLTDEERAALRAVVAGRDAYPDLVTKAAALLQSVVGNHALIDGNKRLGWLATAVFPEINGPRWCTCRTTTWWTSRCGWHRPPETSTRPPIGCVHCCRAADQRIRVFSQVRMFASMELTAEPITRPSSCRSSGVMARDRTKMSSPGPRARTCGDGRDRRI